MSYTSKPKTDFTAVVYLVHSVLETGSYYFARKFSLLADWNEPQVQSQSDICSNDESLRVGSHNGVHCGTVSFTNILHDGVDALAV